MLFKIQAYLEDYLNRRNFVDTDGYAVNLANVYFHHRSTMDMPEFLKRVRRIRTIMFANNRIKDRAEFEKVLIERLDKRFKKKLSDHNPGFLGNTESEKENLQKLLVSHQRRLQKLKEQQAFFGGYTPPYILTEIEDTEEDIESLKIDLRNILS